MKKLNNYDSKFEPPYRPPEATKIEMNQSDNPFKNIFGGKSSLVKSKITSEEEKTENNEEKEIDSRIKNKIDPFTIAAKTVQKPNFGKFSKPVSEKKSSSILKFDIPDSPFDTPSLGKFPVSAPTSQVDTLNPVLSKAPPPLDISGLFGDKSQPKEVTEIKEIYREVFSFLDDDQQQSFLQKTRQGKDLSEGWVDDNEIEKIFETTFGFIFIDEHLKSLESRIISNDNITQESKSKMMEFINDETKKELAQSDKSQPTKEF